MTIQTCGNPVTENIYFDWHLTNWCNYKCSYCPVLDVITNNFQHDEHAVYKFLLARLQHVETSFNVCITGGEPTLHPKLIDILAALAAIPMSQDIAVFTNLSRPTAYYQKIADLNSDKIVVFASYHPEYATDKFTARCLSVNAINNLRFSVHVTLSDKEQYWDSTAAFIDVLKANGVKCKPLILAPTKHYTPEYTDAFYEKFKSYLDNTAEEEFFNTIPITFADGSSALMKSYDVDIQQLNRFKGYTCTPASYSISIDGNIENTCTRRKAPLFLNNANLVVKETCPHDVCPSRRLLEFYKEAK